MGGHGSFSDPRIGISITQEPDLVTPKLPELLRYQLSLSAPHPPYFHDGSAPTLDAVVNHYNTLLGLGLTGKQRADLVEYLKSL